MDAPRLTLTEAVGAITTFVGAITANQEQVEFYLRVAASVVAIVVGIATFYSIVWGKRRP